MVQIERRFKAAHLSCWYSSYQEYTGRLGKRYLSFLLFFHIFPFFFLCNWSRYSLFRSSVIVLFPLPRKKERETGEEENIILYFPFFVSLFLKEKLEKEGDKLRKEEAEENKKEHLHFLLFINFFKRIINRRRKREKGMKSDRGEKRSIFLLCPLYWTTRTVCN
jgi:hypothetical protein